MDLHRQNQILDLATEVASQLPTTFRIRGHKCTENTSVISTGIFLFVFLVGDFDKMRPIQSLKARLGSLVAFLRAHDFNDFLVLTDTMSTLLISELYSGYDGFKRHLDFEAGYDVKDALSILNPFLRSWFLTGNVLDLQACITLGRFFKKLPLVMPDLEEKALKGYMENEEQLAKRDLDSTVLTDLNRIMRRWLEDLTFNNLIPNHGPGVVAECGRNKVLKYTLLNPDAKLRSVIRSINHFNDELVNDYFPKAPAFKLERISRIIFVPKSYKSLRTISAEPATLQYIQQGVKDVLYKYMADNNLLRQHFPLSAQWQNKDLARLGAFTGEVATIDLSSASDLVGYDLVRAVFKNTPLYKWLVATRSSQTELPSGDILNQLKFAPMGSALCFPVETLIFGAVCALSRERNPHEWCHYDTFSVFGDDIVCPTKAYGTIVSLLTSLGFSVNQEKSFNTGHFRESCGGEYFGGLDVTPIYCRIAPLSQSSKRAKAYNQLCDLANYSQERGFRYLRLGAIHLLKSTYKKSVWPLFIESTDRSPYLYSPNPTNFHLKSRWNDELQRVEYSCGSVVAKVRTLTPNDEFEYFDTLLRFARRTSNQGSLRHLDKYIGSKWGDHEAVLYRAWRSD